MMVKKIFATIASYGFQTERNVAYSQDGQLVRQIYLSLDGCKIPLMGQLGWNVTCKIKNLPEASRNVHAEH